MCRRVDTAGLRLPSLEACLHTGPLAGNRKQILEGLPGSLFLILWYEWLIVPSCLCKTIWFILTTQIPLGSPEFWYTSGRQCLHGQTPIKPRQCVSHELSWRANISRGLTQTVTGRIQWVCCEWPHWERTLGSSSLVFSALCPMNPPPLLSCFVISNTYHSKS